MDSLTIVEICAVVIGAVLAVAGVVNTLGSAIEKIVKVVKTAKTPNLLQDERLDELERWRQEVDRRLSSGNTHFDSIDEGNRVTQKALLALLAHGLDGNAVEQMKEAKHDLEYHLINR